MRLDELDALVGTLDLPCPTVVTAAALRVAGADPDTVRRAVRTRWQAAVRGVYVTHREPLTPIELAHVAAVHAGPDVALTGLLAARALGLRWVPDLPGAMVLVDPERRRCGSEGLVLVRRCDALASMETTTWEGLSVAPVAQVVLDACRQVLTLRKATLPMRPSPGQHAWFAKTCLREIRGLVLGAVADRLCTAEELRHVLDAGAMAGSAMIRRACTDAERGAASPPEAELVDGLLTCGVLFACNVEVWEGDVLLAVLDVHLVGTGVGGEMDSKEAHGSEELLDLTLVRHAGLESRDVKLYHVTPTRYRRAPDAFHRDLLDAAARRLAEGKGDPASLRFVRRGPLLQGPRRTPGAYVLPDAEDAPEAA